MLSLPSSGMLTICSLVCGYEHVEGTCQLYLHRRRVAHQYPHTTLHGVTFQNIHWCDKNLISSTDTGTIISPFPQESSVSLSVTQQHWNPSKSTHNLTSIPNTHTHTDGNDYQRSRVPKKGRIVLTDPTPRCPAALVPVRTYLSTGFKKLSKLRRTNIWICKKTKIRSPPRTSGSCRGNV